METKYLNVNDKIKLAYYSEFIPNSKSGVIIVHGLAEHKGRYDEFMDKLLENNISVFAIDLRGHGESLGKRGDITRFASYVKDLYLFISDIKERHPELKLILFGHSLGGLISSSYVAKHDGIDLLILSSPVLSAPMKAKFLVFVPYRIMGFIRLKKPQSEQILKLKNTKIDPLACHTFTFRLLGNMFQDGVKYITKRFSIINIPILMLGGRLDPLVNSGKFASILEKMGSENKTLKIYDNVKHRIVQSDSKDEAISDILEWINRNIQVEEKCNGKNEY